MATHSSTLAWKIPWMEEPCRLQSMGSLRVGHDWATSLSLFTFMHWRRKWQPTPVFLPGESQGQGSLVACHLCGCTELERLKWLSSSSSLYLSMIVFLGCWLITNSMVISWKKCWRNRRNAPRLKIYDRDKHGTRNHQALLKRTLTNE